MSKWDGTVEGFWIAVAAVGRTPGAREDGEVLNEVVELAERSYRYWRNPPPLNTEKPDTVERCHEWIDALDVEINGAVQDYMRARQWAIDQVRAGNREAGESLLKAMRGES